MKNIRVHEKFSFPRCTSRGNSILLNVLLRVVAVIVRVHEAKSRRITFNILNKFLNFFLAPILYQRELLQNFADIPASKHTLYADADTEKTNILFILGLKIFAETLAPNSH